MKPITENEQTFQVIETQSMDRDCKPMLPISPTNALSRVFLVHVYAPNGGVVGLGDCYHPSRETAEDFARGIVRDFSDYRCVVGEYVRVVE